MDGEEIHGSDERIGMVFQKLALMPWKTVMENVEFGLKMKGVPKAQRPGDGPEVHQPGGPAGL